MNSVEQSNASMEKFGGDWAEYYKIHLFLDSPMNEYPYSISDAILHNPFGIWLCEKMFGAILVNTDGKEVCIKEIARYHIEREYGYVPTVQDWLCPGGLVETRNQDSERHLPRD